MGTTRMVALFGPTELRTQFTACATPLYPPTSLPLGRYVTRFARSVGELITDELLTVPARLRRCWEIEKDRFKRVSDD